MGIDAFALNLISTQDWSLNAIGCLFEAASKSSLKLFFSFDMCHFQNPEQFLGLLQQYHQHPSYYGYESRPFVCEFRSFWLSLISAAAPLIASASPLSPSCTDPCNSYLLGRQARFRFVFSERRVDNAFSRRTSTTRHSSILCAVVH